MYKLVYREYGDVIILTSTEEEPLILLIKLLFQKRDDEFELVFFGKAELGKEYNKKPLKSKKESSCQ